MRTKNFKCIKKTLHNGKVFTVMVYGEFTEVKEMTGFYAVPVKFNGKTGKPISIDYNKRIITPSYNEQYSKTKIFNMGWSICAECDTFNEDTGIKICKRRFNRSPIKTQNGRFLTTDMCQAIVNNEVEYIINHIESFLPKNEPQLKFMPMDEAQMKAFEDMLEENIIPFDDEDAVDRALDDGEYVVFYNDDVKYVGIFKNEVYNQNEEWEHDNFYFYAPVDKNGLVVHDKAKFYQTMDNYDEFLYADDDDIKLINDYLKGAHSKAWDNENKKFKILF